MPVVNFTNEKKQIQVPKGANLRREALNAGVQLYPGIHKVFNCHGLGMCGSCRVLVTKGQDHARPPGIWERICRTVLNPLVLMARVGHEDTMRLACQTCVEGDMEVVTRPPINWYGETFYK